MHTPYEQIQQLLQEKIPNNLIKILPKKWEKLGAVLIFKLPESAQPYKQIIAQSYANVLHCTSVLQDVGGISGTFRKPQVNLIYGSSNTETLHDENKIKYLLDPQQVMFSSGNMDERIRMATVSNEKETVVDLFAGIGYFTIPIAVHSHPHQIIACELNPVAFHYLEKNCQLNHVNHIVEPRIGDNRMTAPIGIADRVIMGYFENTKEFLSIAFDCLKPEGGIIHYHNVVPKETMFERPQDDVQKIAELKAKTVTIHKTHVVKSYAPSINHVVVDVKVEST